jgi:predicted 3-demethylubiquinone-9 3-methyltransferase (glyoxalase superfamily)
MATIYPCLWFDGKAKEAAEFYFSVFNNGSITSENQMVVIAEISDQKFMFLNGGPQFRINPSVSFYTLFETAGEVDSAWNKLIEGGSALMPIDKYPWSERYGWLQDRYGVTWQLSLGNLREMGQRFTPSLMFTGDNNGKAGQAIDHYTSIFKDSSVRFISRYEEGENDTVGNIKHAQFLLNGQVFTALESSLMHNFTFNEALSLVVTCDSQEEIDYFWAKLTDGGEESMCGWLKDRYGFSWQIIPSVLEKIMQDPEKMQKAVNAFMTMKKFEIDKLF